MKDINWINVGAGIVLAGLGIAAVIDSIGENQRAADCQARGGNIVFAGEWLWKTKQCIIPPAVKVSELRKAERRAKA
jgi:hypothetical protein